MTKIDGGDFTALRQGSDVGGDGVDFDERHAQQTIPLYPELRRRSKPLAGIDNWFYAVQQHAHAGAGGLVTSVSVYNPPNPLNGYPSAVPEGWDIFLLAVQGQQQAGDDADFTAASVNIFPGAFSQGMGDIDTGLPVEVAIAFTIGHSTVILEDVGTNVMAWDDSGTMLYPRIRLPRGANIGFASEALAATTLRAIFILGVFPMALGQDVAV